ncbi:non-lysosomal glucosylceramidase [Telluria mixta]|uniref:Non-lysosomal glucosylceramidase n=1 Tax=Telluria mixta TaxID=34071 RepID=A0ABT2BTA0_9BURK|nr:non-lysosomal glucosylceramidase [Telluria mixta]MCS0627901.1 non-lysosomal glucosylceramidase [Telluria mixta]WEM93980.1 non-lysosomal glucosylceramidase [Telluria mixta]
METKGLVPATFLVSTLALLAGCAGLHRENGVRAAASSAQAPQGAFVRTLGASKPSTPLVLPPEVQGMGASYVNQSNQGGRGIALGGLGTGSFMLNQQGTFGPWSFNGRQENRVLPQAAFHLFEEVEGNAPTVKTLAAPTSSSDKQPAATSFSYGPNGALLPAWPTLANGEATYKAMYPFGWIEYHGFKSKVVSRFWSPIVAKDELRSSMPVAYFDVQITNRSDRNENVAMMFTFPNAPIHVAGATPPFWLPFSKPHFAPSVRTGHYTHFDVDPKTGVAGVTLGADHPTNTVDAQATEWTIAARPEANQAVSYVTSWNADGDGSDILKAFQARGTLPNAAIDQSKSAGAVSVKAALKPGESTTFRFALVWDIPREVATTPSGERTVWMKRYTERFGAKQTADNDYVTNSYPERQGFNIASVLLGEHDNALKAVESWWSAVVGDPAYPDWVKGAALNQLFYNVYASSFYVNGLVSNNVPTSIGPRLGKVFGDTHLFGLATGGDGADGALMNADVSPYGYLNWAQLFPKVNRDLMRVSAEIVARNPVGALSDFGSVLGGSPFVDLKFSTSGLDGHFGFLDRQPKFVFRAYDEFLRTHDTTYFAYVYPAMVKAYDRFRQNVPAGSHLPVGASSTYDWIPGKGHTLYNSTLYLLATQVMADATAQAVALNIKGATGEARDRYAAELAAAKAEYESTFWDDARQHYRWSSDVTNTTSGTTSEAGLFANGLYGQHLAEQAGLPDLVPKSHLIGHLKSVFRKSALPFKDAGGRTRGVVNLLDNNYDWFGKVVSANPFVGGNDFMARELWAGSSYAVAATMIFNGKRFNDPELVSYGEIIGKDLSYQLWDNPELGFEFNAPEGWDVTSTKMARNSPYMRPLAVWDTLNAFKRLSIPDPDPAAPDVP